MFLGIIEVANSRYPGHFAEVAEIAVGAFFVLFVVVVLFAVRRFQAIAARTATHFVPSALHSFFVWATDVEQHHDDGAWWPSVLDNEYDPDGSESPKSPNSPISCFEIVADTGFATSSNGVYPSSGVAADLTNTDIALLAQENPDTPPV